MAQQNKIYVGNLAFSIEEKGLEESFEQFGTVSEIYIPTDRETGKKRGFAFLTFESQESAEKALSMDGKELEGRAIRVNIAQDKRR